MLVDALDRDAHFMRQLLMQVAQEFLAYDVGNRKSSRVVGDDILREKRLAFLGEGEKRIENLVRAGVVGRDRLHPHGFGAFKSGLGAFLLPRLAEKVLEEWRFIGLVQDEYRLFRALLGDADHPADVLHLRLARRIENDAEDVCAGGAAARHAVQEPPELAHGLVQAGSVEEDELAARIRDDPAHRVARSLLNRRDDRHLLADEPVHERRFAGVRPPDNRYDR